ncbi:unnamed protein product [Cuscuta epithymum]|uniref:TPX2 central domain-containing protein n=1 Tax=Cuscuta epithymum TaxID=186058 RepID=A0AAV0CJZ5_9ASTE|nr:unnamed protein product [Cuscuta epithymum]
MVERFGEGEDEAFYETIEAPKFVDFTSPHHYRPDDRYWFCLRVGCEQQHEDGMDSEKIYKDFVLRVMAARSPNIMLQKALTRRNASRNIKCPMSVPSKFSNPKLLPAISRKLGYEEVKPPANPISTPKLKRRQVAAKYLNTTPRSKKCLPGDSPSVQRTTDASSHNRRAGKKSVELSTPLTNLCEGMKRLQITSHKKKPLANHPSEGKSSPLANAIEVKNSKKSNTDSRAQDSKKMKIFNSAKCNTECNLMGIEAVDLSGGKHIDPKTDDPPSSLVLESNENSENVQDLNCQSEDVQPLSYVEYHEIESTKDDNKENAVYSDENRALNDDNNMQIKILGERINTIEKVAQTGDKKIKDFTITTAGVPPSGLKLKKSKPTTPKPFRLRTDERSILKESNFERRGQHQDHLHRADTQDGVGKPRKRGPDAGGNSKGSANESADSNGNLIKEARRTNTSQCSVGSKIVKATTKIPSSASTVRKVESTLEKKQVMSQRSCCTKHTIVISGIKLATIDESCSKRTKTRGVNDNGGAMAIHQHTTSSLRSFSQRRRRQVTDDHPPQGGGAHFHTSSHVPKSCSKKIS